MINLKTIIFKIACLAKSDQRWILNKLPKRDKTLFNQRQGRELLQQARRFRQLNKDSSLLFLSLRLENYQQTLAKYCPFYITIILEQGKFSWETQFLELFDRQGLLQSLLQSPKLKQLKRPTKQALFKQWQENHAFDRHLEQSHG